MTSNDDARSGQINSQVDFSAVAGTVYRIALDGYNGDAGDIALSRAALAKCRHG